MNLRSYCFFSLLGFCQAVYADDDAMAWLEKMLSASQMRSYEGTFIYAHDGQMETMSIVHGYDGQQERERVLSLNGEAREVIREGNNVTCIWPDSQKVMVDHGFKKSFPAQLPPDLTTLKPQYQFNALGRGRVAGRNVQIIQIKPTDEYRYGFTLWLDQATSIPLQSIRTDVQEQPIEQILYTTFEPLDQVDEHKLRPRIMGKSYSWMINEKNNTVPMQETHWTAAQLPVGYILVQASMEQMPGNNEQVERLLFSDGLSSVSVYIETGEQSGPVVGSAKMGAMTAFGLKKGDYYITAVGEVPQMTTQLIAESLRKP